MQKPKDIRIIETDMHICSISLSPDGKSIATGGQNAQYHSGRGGIIQIQEIEKKNQQFLYSMFKATIDALCYSQGGQYLVAGSSDGTVCILNSQTLQQYGQTMVNSANVVVVLITRYSTQIISAGYQKEIRIWRLHNQKQITRIKSDGLCVIQISPKGSLLIISANSGKIQFRNCKFHKSIRIIKIRKSGSSCLTFTNDGQLLATSTHQFIDIVNVANGQIVSLLTSHLWIQSIEFSLKKNIILSSGSDRTIRIWNYFTGEQMRKIEFRRSIPWIKFSQNNEFLISQLGSDKIQISKLSCFI